MAKTLLAIGAHYDDCPFGIPGIMLKAIRKNYRVVILSIIGDYRNWKPVAGRHEELLEGTKAICRDYGADIWFLPYASMNYEVTEETKRAVAEVVAEIQPDVALSLWPHDRHPDHEVASRLAKVGLGYGDRLLKPGQKFKRPRRQFQFDNGPRHTIGFEPNTFVDVTDDWPQAMDWLGRMMALVRNEEYDPDKRDGAQKAKETLAKYRGSTCGVQYAEAVYAVNEYANETLFD